MITWLQKLLAAIELLLGDDELQCSETGELRKRNPSVNSNKDTKPALRKLIFFQRENVATEHKYAPIKRVSIYCRGLTEIHLGRLFLQCSWNDDPFR